MLKECFYLRQHSSLATQCTVCFGCLKFLLFLLQASEVMLTHVLLAGLILNGRAILLW
jgi:hypothetical protein